jgi:hypothetical protein
MTTSSTALTQLGVPAEAANKLGNATTGTPPTAVPALAGVGTAQTGAKAVKINAARLTTAGGATAFVLDTAWEIGDTITLFNTSATTALLFPQSGGAINGGSTNASIAVAQNTGVQLLKATATS